VNIAIVHDAIGVNASRLPPGPAAGYVTGSGIIPWTNAQFASHPGAVRIDQTPAGTAWDDTADVDDVERGAVELGEIADRAKARKAAFDAAKRPGQRLPAVYVSASGVTDVANALIAGGVDFKVGLWVANWSAGEATAQRAVQDAAGPFPIIAWQFASNAFYDTSVFSGTWLTRISVDAPNSYKHLTVPGDTLGSLADARSMDVFSWLTLQQRLSGPQAEHLARHAAAEAGSTWRSVSP
jgi:hypothetical protein